MLIKAKNWTCKPDQKQSIMVFVQRSRELLLHTTSILRKPEVASVFLIVRELDFLIKETKDSPHKTTEKHISLLLEELDESIKKDEVAKRLIGDRYGFILKIIKSESDPNARIDAIGLLGSRIARIEYLSVLKNKVIEIIAEGGKQKKRLVDLADCAIYAILDAGYPAQTIYHLLNITFLNKDDSVQVTGRETFDKFFSYFDLRRHDYFVIFGVTDESGDADYHMENNLYSVHQKDSAEYEEFIGGFTEKNKQFFKIDKISGIFVSKIKALDPQSARANAEKNIGFLSSMLQLKRHKIKLAIQNEAIVYREDKKEYVHSNRPKAPVLRIPHDSDIAVDELAKFINRLSAIDVDSVSRFTRAIQLHSSAVNANQVEVQLLNLWIAFETLFIRESVEKLSKIISCVEPYLFTAIAVYDINELYQYIERHHSVAWEAACSKSEKLSALTGGVRLLAMVALPDFDNEAKDFLSSLDSDPLLRFRIGEKARCGRKAKDLNKFFDHISRLVKFDLSRIYRARNQIVHVGYSAADLGEIVQRAHHYLDIVLTMIETLVAKPGGAFSIEQATMEVEMVQKGMVNLVDAESKKDSSCSFDDYITLHWGRPLLA